MKKKKKGKVRWLAVLLAGCLLLSIVPVTAFASEDTDPTKSENAVGEETQLTEQQNATEETKMGAVTPAPKDETKATDNGVSGTSAESKNDKAEKPQPSEQPDAEKNTTDENGIGTSRSSYQHTYHTNIKVTANVTIQDKEGNTTTESIYKESGFIKGNVSDTAVQTQITDFKNAIKANYNSTWNFTEQNITTSLTFDHFESSNIIDGDSSDSGVNTNLDIHEYQIYDYTYDLIVQENSQPTSTITAATIENAKFDYQPGDAPQATAEVTAADADKYEIAYECWQEFENNEPVAAWYSDNGSHGSLPTITKFESGKEYVYFVMLKQKDGYSFSSETAVTVNGESVKSSLSGEFLYLPAVKTITMPTIKVIDVVEVNDVTVSFKDGDKPVFTGKVPDGADYAFRCEWWSLDENTGIVSTEPEWGGDIYKNKITAFEAGKTYHYGVYVTAYTADISPDAKLKINGREVEYTRVGDDGDTQSFWVETDLTMTPTSDPAKKEIPVVEINNATLTFKDGDKPVFTGTTPDDAPYVLVFEEWRTDGEWTRSDEWFNNADHHGNDKDITAFDKNKSYNYTLYVKTNSKGAEEGWYFGQNTKLKINGKEVSFTRDVSDSEYHFSGATGITMTPTADGHTHSYGKAWIYDSANHWHECSCGDKSDTAAHTFKWVTDKEATATEKESKHEECSVCGYKKADVEIPATGSTTQPTNPNKPTGNKTGETTSPKTGDTSNMFLWLALLLASGGAVVIVKKKKYNR